MRTDIAPTARIDAKTNRPTVVTAILETAEGLYSLQPGPDIPSISAEKKLSKKMDTDPRSNETRRRILCVVSPLRAILEPREKQIMTVAKNPKTIAKFGLPTYNSERSEIARKKAIITSAIFNIHGMTSDFRFIILF